MVQGFRFDQLLRDKMFWITLFVLLLLSSEISSSRKHIIYWDPVSTPELLSKNTDYVLHVKMGHFMDILCPQTSLREITNGPDPPQAFNLYNVTKPDFDSCSGGNQANFIFACNRPERENKLTMKFQRISPSPLGFRFQYCQDYYFVAVPRKPRPGSGCHNNTSTRLRISVACKHPRRTNPIVTSTTVATTTKATTSSEPDVDSKEDIVVPDVVSPQTTSKKPESDFDVESHIRPQTGEKNNSENSSHRSAPARSMHFIVSILALIFISILTSSNEAFSNT